MYSSGSGKEQQAGSCKHSSGNAVSMECGVFLDWLKKCFLGIGYSPRYVVGFVEGSY